MDKAKLIQIRNWCAMAKEELCFGGDWTAAKTNLQRGIEELNKIISSED